MSVPNPSPGPAGDPPPRSDDATALEDLQCSGVPADPGRLVLLREQLADWVLRAGLSEEIRERVLLATYEAMANVVVHAYREATGPLDLHATSRNGLITVSVTDYGRWQPVARPTPLHGRGLPLIRRLTSEASIDTTAAGTTVTMTFLRALPGDPRAAR
ncbi:ATP-binding protein [Amycolatopsis sp. WQ 127309]|uniref:ATP-binding protein n=1 Tax=Amycolatopsis sp. WQ 127309 TaxID=2932773 RepID=UPI001FF18894|nr:ATP-binding protein [Amycolatopsis sp. WQ 127309]UOZ03335.1 ATP-binding protein [Amycolatopsis sp. WQ 127309]